MAEMLELERVVAGYGDAIVLDQQHADVARQLRDHAEQFLGVPFGHARRGLIE